MGAPENATIINFYDEDFKDRAVLIPKNKRYVYCLSREGVLKLLMADLGQKIFNLTGGINALAQ